MYSPDGLPEADIELLVTMEPVLALLPTELRLVRGVADNPVPLRVLLH